MRKATLSKMPFTVKKGDLLPTDFSSGQQPDHQEEEVDEDEILIRGTTASRRGLTLFETSARVSGRSAGCEARPGP